MSNDAVGATRSECIFCRIIARTVPADIVAESPQALAFRDLSPVAPTHVLIVPKRHVVDAGALGPDDGEMLAAIYVMANEIARLEGVEDSGFRLVFNVGDDAGNSVSHLHLHLLAGRSLHWPPG